jgi:prevent-host-death family protein
MTQKMQTVTLHDAETRLAKLAEQADRGEAFIISKAGRPMFKVIPFDTNIGHAQRLGFMAGEMSVPEDFDCMGSSEIAALFV